MDDLVRFLRDRLDETAAKAEAARGDGDGRWHQDDADRYPGRIVDSKGGIVTFDEGAPDEAQAAHIARHDPARVLAEVETKRRIIARVENHAFLMGRDEIHGDLLRLLALTYADHPDYREEWRP